MGRRHRDDDRSAGERRQHLTQPFRAGDGIELVAPFDEARGRRRVQVGPEGDDEDVALIGALVGDGAFALGIDGQDGLLTKRDPRLGDRVVGEADRRRLRLPNMTSSFA